jgi:hypothetical protein
VVPFGADVDLIERALRVFRQRLVRRALYLVDQDSRGRIRAISRPLVEAFAD